ncbi:MAG: GatB/YqeY domain-containing protein [Anaerolineae bacterium]|nr:GatB/YqeY domain-containing protein [Anaerolineae bacterium]
MNEGGCHPARYNKAMPNRQDIENALREAMRARDEISTRTLRMIVSAIKFAEIEKGQALDERAITSILQKEMKSRRESIEDARKAQRPDLEEAVNQEIAVIEKFLPSQLSDTELETLVRAAIAEAGATAPSDMGKVMKVLLPKIQGRAAGDKVSQAVKKILAG